MKDLELYRWERSTDGARGHTCGYTPEEALQKELQRQHATDASAYTIKLAVDGDSDDTQPIQVGLGH